MAIQSINPATDEVIDTFAETSPEELERTLADGHATFLDWRARPFAERSARMHEAARLLRDRKDALARTMTLEMGKPIVQARGRGRQVRRDLRLLRRACRALPRRRAARDGRDEELRALRPARHRPRRDAVELSLLAGLPLRRSGADGRQCRPAQARLERPAVRARDRGHLPATPAFPPGSSAPRSIGSSAVGGLIADARVAAVTLTGSEHAGSRVAERAGREIKKTVLELGGSDPFIVLADADLAQAAKVAADARLINSGQSCISAKRFIVVEPVRDEFMKRFADELGARRMGDPLARDTEVGPQARRDLRDDAASPGRGIGQARRAARRSAARSRAGRGAFYPPTCSRRSSGACRPSTRRPSGRSPR